MARTLEAVLHRDTGYVNGATRGFAKTCAWAAYRLPMLHLWIQPLRHLSSPCPGGDIFDDSNLYANIAHLCNLS